VALGELIGRYQASVVALIRHRKHPPHLTPEELKQEFFVGMLKRDDVLKLSEEKGHFRGWLKTAVWRFLSNEWGKWYSGGNDVTGSLSDAGNSDAGHGDTPEHLYLMAFAQDTLNHALALLRAETLAKPSWDERKFDALKVFLPGPEIDLERQAAVAESLGMAVNALRVAIWHLRERLKEILREAVAETLDIDPSDPDSGPESQRETALIYRYLYDKPQG
jgi:hypothetical protein